MEFCFLCAILLFVIVPLFSLVIFAFSGTGGEIVSLDAFAKIFLSGRSLSGATAFDAVLYSLAAASFASVLATLIGLLASLRGTKIPFVGYFLGSSIAVSAITLALGYFIGFGSGSLLVIAVGHAVFAFPFAYRLIGNALAKVGDSEVDAAASMGAGPLETFRRVQFPAVRGALLASLAFSFAVSLGELGLVLMLYDGIYPTMPVYVYRLLSVFDVGAAAAMGIILVGVSFFCFYAIEHFSADAGVF